MALLLYVCVKKLFWFYQTITADKWKETTKMSKATIF